MASDILKEFESRNTYNYLQLCYHQLGKTREAANAAYTHLVHIEVEGGKETNNLLDFLAGPQSR